MDPTNVENRQVDPPALTVIPGMTYWDQSQVFNRWLLPTYQTLFLWTGNRFDAEDATTWVFTNVAAQTRLPEPVGAVDYRVAEATLEAATRHWSDRYGFAYLRWSEIYAHELALSEGPLMTLAELVDGLSAEMRLVIVLRFLRRRPLGAIATQLGVPEGTANVRLQTALLAVARRIGFDAGTDSFTQADRVAAFVDDLIAKRRPHRFEAMSPAWAALLAAAHIQAAVAGNNLPRRRFIGSLEEALNACRGRRHVTDVRIWSA